MPYSDFLVRCVLASLYEASYVGPSVGRSVGPAFAKKVIFSEGNDLKVIFLEGNDLKVKFSEGNDLKVIHTERNDLKVILSVK